MSDTPSPDDPKRAMIELEPLGSEVAPADHQQPGATWSVNLSSDPGNPIPDRPGYRCPQCDYDLRKLPGRVCPECGSPFTIGEARVAGLAHDPRAADDHRAMLQHKILVRASIAAFVLCFFAPFVVSGTWPTAGMLFIQLILTLPFLVIGAGAAYIFMRTVSESAIIATALYLGFTIVYVALFW